MKKEVIILSLILLLSISFVSAGWWGDFWGKFFERVNPSLSPNIASNDCVQNCLNEKCLQFESQLRQKACLNNDLRKKECEEKCVVEEQGPSVGNVGEENSNVPTLTDAEVKNEGENSNVVPSSNIDEESDSSSNTQNENKESNIREEENNVPSTNSKTEEKSETNALSSNIKSNNKKENKNITLDNGNLKISLSDIVVKGRKKTGQPLTFSGTVTNLGKEEKQIRVALTDDWAFIKERSLILSAHQTKEFEITYWPFFSGERRFAIDARDINDWENYIEKEYYLEISGDDLPTDKCADGTEFFTCSGQQPLYCVKNMYWDQYPNLYDYCFECGCPNGEICQEEGSCKTPQESKNRAPYADAGLDKVVYKGESFQLNAFDSWDKDYWQTLTYSWEENKNSRTNIRNGVTPIVTFDQEGVHEVELTVSDGELKDKDTITIGVAENSPWWNNAWKKRITTVLENKNEAKNNLPVFIRLEDIFGKHYKFTDEILKSIRVVSNDPQVSTNGLKYGIFDWDKVEGITPYDFLVFTVSINANEAKTVYVYYDNDNAGQVDYLDFYNDIVLNGNNLIRNPNMEEICEHNEPCEWQLWNDDNYEGTYWYDEQSLDCTKNSNGDCSFHINYPQAECNTISHLHGMYQDTNINGGAPHVLGYFMKSDAAPSYATNSAPRITSIFPNADISNVIKNMALGDDGYPSWLYESCGLYSPVYNKIEVFQKHDWSLYFADFITPVDEYEAHLSIFTQSLGEFWFDDMFFFEQPKIIISQEEPSTNFASADFDSFFVYNTFNLFPDDKINQIKKFKIDTINVAKNEIEIIPFVLNSNINLDDVDITVSSPKCIEAEIRESHFTQPGFKTMQTYNEQFWADPLPLYKTQDLSSNRNHILWLKLYITNDCDSGEEEVSIKINPGNTKQEFLSLNVKIKDFSLPEKTDLFIFAPDTMVSDFLFFNNIGFTQHEARSVYWYDSVFDYLDFVGGYEMNIRPSYHSLIDSFCYDTATDEVRLIDTGRNNYLGVLRYSIENAGMDSFLIFKEMFTHWQEEEEETIWIETCDGTDILKVKPWSEEYNITVNSVMKYELNSIKNINPEAKVIYKIGGEVWGLQDRVHQWIDFETKFFDLIKDIRRNIIIPSESNQPYDECLEVKEHQSRFDTITLDFGYMPLLREEGLEKYRQEVFDFSIHFESEVPIDSPIRNSMVPGWLAWRLKFKGIKSENWAPRFRPNYEGGSLWDNPMVEYFFKINGDMYLTYPGIDSEYTSPTEEVTPIPSIRMEMFREGMEDYKKFWLLNDLIEKAKQRGINTQNAESSLARVTEGIDPETYELVDNPQLIYEIRSQIADEIENLLEQMPDVKEGYSPEEKGFFSSIWSKVTGKVIDLFS